MVGEVKEYGNILGKEINSDTVCVVEQKKIRDQQTL
jgi:hypothetical protein